MAAKYLLAKRPNTVLYGLRIGFPTAYRSSNCFSATLTDGTSKALSFTLSAKKAE